MRVIFARFTDSVFLSVLLCILSACSTSSVQIKGNVLDVDTGIPIDGVHVSLKEVFVFNSYGTHTDPAGEFNISGSRFGLLSGDPKEGVSEEELSQVYKVAISHPRYVSDTVEQYIVVEDTDPLLIDLGVFYMALKPQFLE